MRIVSTSVRACGQRTTSLLWWEKILGMKTVHAQFPCYVTSCSGSYWIKGPDDCCPASAQAYPYLEVDGEFGSPDSGRYYDGFLNCTLDGCATFCQEDTCGH